MSSTFLKKTFFFSFASGKLRALQPHPKNTVITEMLSLTALFLTPCLLQESNSGAERLLIPYRQTKMSGEQTDYAYAKLERSKINLLNVFLHHRIHHA